MLAIDRLVSALESYVPGSDGILSLYLRTDPSGAEGRNLHAQTAGVTRGARARVDRSDQAAFDDAVDRAVACVRRLSPLPRAVAVFVAPERGFEITVPLRVPVAATARWSRDPHLVPLMAQLDEHERVLVLLVDKRRARVFNVFMGEIEEVAHLEDDVPPKHRRGRGLQRAFQGSAGVVGMGYDSPTIQRRHEWRVRRHVEHALDALVRADRWGVGRVLVAGPPEVLAGVDRLLPDRLRGVDVGRLSVSVTASVQEVLEAALPAAETMEREQEAALVAELAEDSRARLGLAAVAEAVADGQVQTFVYVARPAAPGAECGACHWIVHLPDDGSGDPCPRCGGELRPEPDLIDLMVRRTIERGGRVEEVRGEAAERLRFVGGVAARLRYAPPTAASTGAESYASTEGGG